MKILGKEDFICEESPYLEVEVNVAYWRKANHIHRWFVEHAQEGVDDCKSYYVDIGQLEELRDTCKTVLSSTTLVNGKVTAVGKFIDIIENGKVLKDPTVAEKLLPTQEGFFFGGTFYDAWYYRDLQDTVDQIDNALTNFPDWDFYYRSSW